MWVGMRGAKSATPPQICMLCSKGMQPPARQPNLLERGGVGGG